MRTRGNGSGCVTSYMTAKNKKRWRVRAQYDFYISPFKLWQLTGYVYQRDEIEFQKMEERKKTKKKG